MAREIIIFTDGACLGNPGRGAAASVVASETEVVELKAFESVTTNNRMEMLGLLQALQFLLKKNWIDEGALVKVHADSQYLLDGIQKWLHGWKRRGWKTAEGSEVKNREIWEALDQATKEISARARFEWSYVPGHQGVPGNERCDEIANATAMGDDVNLYAGSRAEYLIDLLSTEPDPRLAAKKKKKASAPPPRGPTYYITLIADTLYRDSTWSQCEARVRGTKSAKYKKCRSPEEEKQTLEAWGVSAPKEGKGTFNANT